MNMMKFSAIPKFNKLYTNLANVYENLWIYSNFSY